MHEFLEEPLGNRHLKPSTELIMEMPASVFFGERPLCRLRDTLKLVVTGHTYLPKPESPRSDWITVAALPAFLALRERSKRSGIKILSFCAIGTGAGIDAMAAVEVFSPRYVVVTDLHSDVVRTAVSNIGRNLLNPDTVKIVGCVGALGTPLHKRELKFDLIYENLPNGLPIPRPNMLRPDQGDGRSC
jgi:methylase of polypeptide subunit release factors